MNIWIEKWMKIYLKCFLSSILYHRNVYPAASFDITTYQAFNLPQFTPMNRHPEVQDYIEELVLDVLSKLVHIYGLSLCVMTKEDNMCIERYVLSFDEFRHVDDVGTLTESEVFDEFRSSFNSLTAHLEKLDPIRDDTVVFEVVINTMEMELGHLPQGRERLKDKEDKLEFERETNWTKCDEDEGLPENIGVFKPKIKMSSLVGCDVGPLIIRNHCEKLLVSDNSLDNVYLTSQGSNVLGSL
ncbi:hypothetical protein HG536_0B02690 [Torulaspora globosa]|uniref:HORMA domain-containing protein n=1 Tax=Torulaspora globosa TaxID=48254 RepID=A0A7G3ZD20_9SACH|nr:uncharacterized protein HG536_0B02690 [Torulaspora globosa]QLL31406.1 hypothetical protein HG536_0B02690 [Torulaspora globosa]